MIYCAGNTMVFRKVANETGWLNGARLPGTVYDPPLYFADQDYQRPDRKVYMEAVARHRPKVATVMDWEEEDQWPEVMEWAEEISRLVEQVVIIPKIPGTLDAIPEKVGSAGVILGYSVPTSYGGTVVPVWEFGRRPVHLLGGSPHKQMDLAQYLNVVSADGNMAQQQAIRGRFWSRKKTMKGHWVQLSETGDVRTEGAYLEAFRRSCLEIMAAWRRWGS